MKSFKKNLANTGILFLCWLFSGCGENKVKEIPFKLDKVETISVAEQIKDFKTAQVIAWPHVTFLGDYLLITDMKATMGKAIHVYDNASHAFITSTGETGEGPGELLNVGEMSLSHNPKEFWIPDFSKLRLFRFDLDSILSDEDYMPQISFPIKSDFFLTRFKVFKDLVAIGSGLEVFSPYEYRTSLGLWNIETGICEKFGDEHPELLDKRTKCFFDYSLRHHIMALAYINYDIMTVFDEFGKAKFHILGEGGFPKKKNKGFEFFGRVKITEEYIITTYLNDFGSEHTQNGPRGKMSSRLLFFDHSGNLLRVLESGNPIMNFSVDEKNKRIFCYFPDREEPIGYFSYDL